MGLGPDFKPTDYTNVIEFFDQAIKFYTIQRSKGTTGSPAVTQYGGFIKAQETQITELIAHVKQEKEVVAEKFD